MRPAAEWLDLLGAPPAGETQPEPVRVRQMIGRHRAVRYDDELIGWVESFGDPQEGTLQLADDELGLRLARGDTPLVVRIADLTAVQPSSTSLQVRARDGLVLSVRFLESSVLRWEALLQNAVRDVWMREGRGEVIDFQPRIVTR